MHEVKHPLRPIHKCLDSKIALGGSPCNHYLPLCANSQVVVTVEPALVRHLQ